MVNDTFAVLRAGLEDAAQAAAAPADGGASPGSAGQHWGVGVTCGAGINCVGVAPDGRTTRFLSLGEISGDWGGGGTLARRDAVVGGPGRGRPGPGRPRCARLWPRISASGTFAT